MKNWDAGNFYVLTETAKGVPTFRHVSTGENLHGQAGPWEEAISLYIEPSGVLGCEGEVVVYDVGMGCAAQVLAMLWAWRQNGKMRKCTVVSFDLEKRGVFSLLENCERFPFAKRERSFLGKMCETNCVTLDSDDGRQFCWQFVEGDFRDTIRSTEVQKNAKADFIFYDFFSPSSHPYLWTYELFCELRKCVSDSCLLFTYSCATRVRAALLAAGFFVGFGVPSGKKAKTTVAAVNLVRLKEPLPHAWVDTFQRSHAGFLECERAELIPEITQKVLLHRQFCVP
jgi:queuine tRNA-ribosyltransferase